MQEFAQKNSEKVNNIKRLQKYMLARLLHNKKV